MIDSNSSLDRRSIRSARGYAAAALFLALCAQGAFALDPNRDLSQYIRDDWGVSKGLPAGTIYAISQSADGYLWIGGEKGLIRFDGLSFRVFGHADVPALNDGAVLGLATDSDGTMWIRSQGPGLIRYRDGVFETALTVARQYETDVTAMCLGTSRELLVAYRNAAVRYSGGKFQPVSLISARPLVISMAETSDGEVWMGTRDVGLFSAKTGRIVTPELHDSKINALLSAGGEQLWVGTDNGVLRWNGSELTRTGVPAEIGHVQTLDILRDSESNVWFATAKGLWRSNNRGAERLDGSASSPVTALFEDRENNLWIGTTQGLERLRDSVFLTYADPGTPDSPVNGPVYVDPAGRTWFAPSGGGLGYIQGAKITRVTQAGLDRDVVYSIAGYAGDVWVGRQRGGLTRLALSGSMPPETVTQANGLAQNSVYAVYRSDDGIIWAGTLNGGVSAIRDRHIRTFTSTDGLASNTISAIEETPDGTMWFATPNGISSYSQGKWRTFSGVDGVPPGGVHTLFTDSRGTLWIGTSKGPGFLKNGRVIVPSNSAAALIEDVFGIAEDKAERLWISTTNHVIRMDRDKLMSGSTSDSDVRDYSSADGLESTQGVRRYRSVVTDSLGRVWFSLNRAISVVDPSRLNVDSTPALVHVVNIAADGSPVALGASLRIPSARRRITFQFVGLSLTVPERVRYRYRLDDFDHGWSDPTAAREAVYTNLAPGSYRFRVIASNASGAWNGKEAVRALEITPAFWQTTWFRLLAFLASVTAILMLYRLRLHQLSQQLGIRFEERIAERTRIAQELHDTLLQGLLSASMQLSVALDSLPSDSAAKPRLSRVLQLMAHVIEEGRNAVRGLRSPGGVTTDLEQAFSRIPREMVEGGAIDFRVIVEGKPRPLHPLLRDEVYRIGHEAIVNAFRHSRANHVEVELEYTPDRMRVLVRDDGCGIDQQVLKSGREGHWGLTGMRERAERIGARLSVFSRATAGTEVELSVPAHIAYQSEESAPKRSAAGSAGGGTAGDRGIESRSTGVEERR